MAESRPGTTLPLVAAGFICLTEKNEAHVIEILRFTRYDVTSTNEEVFLYSSYVIKLFRIIAYAFS